MASLLAACEQRQLGSDGWRWLQQRSDGVEDDVRGAIRLRGGETAATQRLVEWVWSKTTSSDTKKPATVF